MALIAKSQEAEAVLRIVLKRSLNLKAVLEVVAEKEVLRSILAGGFGFGGKKSKSKSGSSSDSSGKKKGSFGIGGGIKGPDVDLDLSGKGDASGSLGRLTFYDLSCFACHPMM